MHILDERFAPGQIDLEGDWRATRPTARLANLLAAGRAHQPVTEVQHGRATRGDPSVVTNANRLRRFRTVTITDPSARWDIEPTTVEIGPQQEVEDATSTTASTVTDPACVMAIEAGSAVAPYVLKGMSRGRVRTRCFTAEEDAPHDGHAEAVSSAVTTCTTRAPLSSTSTRVPCQTLQVELPGRVRKADLADQLPLPRLNHRPVTLSV